MTTPVDLTNLREMTGNDAEMEKALFEEFYSSFETGIATLQKNTTASAANTWRQEVHALKGIALNLGAIKLGELCKQAQDSFSSDEADKNKMLQHIQAEYAQVKVFLQGLR